MTAAFGTDPDGWDRFERSLFFEARPRRLA